MFQVLHLSKSYQKHLVLNDISFQALPGECIGLIGPNGCGKSTLLQIISGMIKPDSGDILLDGESFLKHPALFSKKIGYLPQNNPLFEDMTALDHLKLWYSGSSSSLQKDLEDGFPALLEINQFLNKKVGDLSGGMKKRLSLACALANQPPLVFLDEPAAALDLLGKEEIREYISHLQKSGKIVLLATHESAYFPVCTKLLLFRDGTLTEVSNTASTAQLLDYLKHSGACV